MWLVELTNMCLQGWLKYCVEVVLRNLLANWTVMVHGTSAFLSTLSALSSTPLSLLWPLITISCRVKFE